MVERSVRCGNLIMLCNSEQNRNTEARLGQSLFRVDSVEKVSSCDAEISVIQSVLLAGLKIMMGHRQVEQAALFYEFSLERHIPTDHLLRSIDRFVDLEDLRRELAPFYSNIGRPSIDPELMIRIGGQNFRPFSTESASCGASNFTGRSVVAASRRQAVRRIPTRRADRGSEGLPRGLPLAPRLKREPQHPKNRTASLPIRKTGRPN